MKNLIVGIADLKISSSPDLISSLGLGSCVGVTLYDPQVKIGGLVHIMLPSGKYYDNNSNPLKFADSGIQELLKQVLLKGAMRARLQAKMAGGAEMFASKDRPNVLMVGKRNIITCKAVLESLSLRVYGEDTGGNFGRSLEFDTASGRLKIKTIGHGENYI